VGYFPTYTLGNLLSAQIYYKIKKDITGLEDGFAKGKFTPLLNWLREKIHRQGRRYMYLDTCKRVSGTALDEDNFMRYLKEKYGSLFGIQF
jgi:carboxypeptidase Taq